MKTLELAEHLRERLRRFEQQEQEKLKEKQYKETLVSVKFPLPQYLFSLPLLHTVLPKLYIWSKNHEFIGFPSVNIAQNETSLT